MRYATLALLLALAATPLPAQDSTQQKPDGPTNEKAQKTYKEGLEFLRQRNTLAAVDCFKKADKQDGGRCLDCRKKMFTYGVQVGDWKTGEFAAQETLSQARGNQQLALAHYDLGWLLIQEGFYKRKDELFARAHDELTKALAAYPDFPEAVFSDGQALAHLNQDDAAKAQFQRFVKLVPADDPKRQRALHFISDPELARARMVPAFSVTTMNGQRVSLDDLQGKVVLLDFWATSCVPCREALPHMRQIAKKFEGQPFVILSVSLDSDEETWKEFVAKNGMTWLNYRDGFEGSISKLFGVKAIPHTFTIDSDGVLQDEHVGDASLEGRLKKLIAKARAVPPAPEPAVP